MEILSNSEIDTKIRRLSYEILEQHYDEKRIYLSGINNSGYSFAELIKEELQALSDKKIELLHLKINPAEPQKEKATTDFNTDKLHEESLIIIDDVANTGRTLFYACQPFLNTLPRRIETCVLVDRKHKYFPVSIDYYGLSLATTLQDNIQVNIDDKNNKSATLS